MSRRRVLGVTLIELVVFIVIVGIAMAALFSAFNAMTAGSADPQVRKQVLAIAESLMDEVALMPFTFCDPDDEHAATATSTSVSAAITDCKTTAEIAAASLVAAPTIEGETRGDASAPFDNVNDYHGFTLPAPPGIKNIGDIAAPGLSAYSASITVTQAGLTATSADPPVDEVIAAPAALLIRVTVTGPNGTSVTLEGYRTRYAPNTLP